MTKDYNQTKRQNELRMFDWGAVLELSLVAVIFTTALYIVITAPSLDALLTNLI